MRRAGSLRRRLLLSAFAFLSLALIAAGFVINAMMQRFVAAQIADRLDAQLLTLAGAIDVDADQQAFGLLHEVDVAPYDRPLSGWYWTVVAATGQTVLASRSLLATGARLALPGEDRGSVAAAAPADTSLLRLAGPDGQPLLARTRTLALADDAGPISLLATAPASSLEAPAAGIRRTLIGALGALGLLLALAVVVQVRLGLAPLARLSESLRRLRAAEASRIEGRQPAEVQPLVDEIHGLIDQNAERLQRSRDQVANLAHGLKTPLAKLAVLLERAEAGSTRPAATAQQALLTELDRRIAHHLRRARSAALAGPQRSSAPLKRHLDDLIGALTMIHRERSIRAEITVDPALWVACDPLDLDEMLGNLLDNAFKWARTRIRVQAARRAQRIEIEISDDGPGLGVDPSAVLGRGQRADSATPGTGFGLSITVELATLYGGSLVLAESGIATAGGDDFCGLSLCLRLPQAPVGAPPCTAMASRFRSGGSAGA